MNRIIMGVAMTAAVLTAVAQASAAQRTVGREVKEAFRAEREVPWNRTIIWDRVMQDFDARGVEVVRVDRAIGNIEGLRHGVNGTGWASCSGAISSDRRVDMVVDVALRRGANEQETKVTVQPHFTSDGQVLRDCTSTGKFEEELLSRL